MTGAATIGSVFASGFGSSFGAAGVASVVAGVGVTAARDNNQYLDRDKSFNKCNLPAASGVVAGAAAGAGVVSVGAAPLVGVASAGFVSAGFASAGFSSFLVLELLPFKMLLNRALRSDNAFGAAVEMI